MRAVGLALAVMPLLGSLSAHACLWESGTKIDGASVPTSSMLPGHVAAYTAASKAGAEGMRVSAEGGAEGQRDSWKDLLGANGALCASTGSVEACNDQAVALVHLRRSAEAIPLLEAIEKRTPGLYQTAVNLGTALELSGQDALALKWITEGMRRNPQSHQGTEWLHLKILEAKLATKNDANWLRSHAVLDGSESGPTGMGGIPVWRAGGVLLPSGQALAPEDVIKAIDYQLRERFQFVQPPEPIVGDLLMELASLVALTGTVESAMPILDLAEKFKPERAGQFAERKKRFKDLLAANPDSGERITFGGDSGVPMSVVALVIVLVMSGAAAGGFVWHRRARRRKLAV